MKSRLLPVILTAAVTSLGTFYAASRFQDRLPFSVAAHTPQPPVNYANYDGNAPLRSTAPVDFQNAAEASVKAVVHIKTTTNSRTVVANDPFAELFGFGDGMRRQYMLPPQSGSGSGVVFDPEGYIVTNNHVVAGADQVTVTFNDRYTTQAKVVGTDPNTDIAVLKVNEKDLPYMEFGNSDNVKLGQWVLAVGYPLSLDATVTAGIVSAKSRSIGINQRQSQTAIESFIQTDAAVNPGNSGGALVNTDGQLIGINSAIASPTGSYAGYSYAVPANIVRKVVADIREYGTVQRAFLGIGYINRKATSPEELSALGIDRTEGVYVANVMSNSGAQAAGIRKGDFITAINGTAVRTEPELQEQLARYKPGDNISVTYLRSGNQQKVSVQLKNSEGTTAVLKNQGSANLLGATFRNLTSDEKKSLSVAGGVMVTDVGNGSLRAQTNMRKGFVITSVNERAIRTVEELQRMLSSSGGNLEVAGFYPGYKGMYYYGISPQSDIQPE